jgi:hypothetical protein
MCVSVLGDYLENAKYNRRLSAQVHYTHLPGGAGKYNLTSYWDRTLVLKKIEI